MKLSHIFWRQSKSIAVLGFVIFSLCYYSISYASTTILGYIEADTTWDMAGSPYLVSHSIAIIPDVTLTIDPGVIVKFDYNASLNVIGKLAAHGTEAQPIYFTSLYDDTLGGDTDDEEELCTEQIDSDGNPTGVEVCEVLDLNDPLPGDWDGLFFNSPLASSLENVSLSYSADALVFYGTNATLKNINIKESETGMSVYANSHLEFSGGDIRNLNREAMVLFNKSSINLKDVNISNIADDPISIFNESTFTADNLHIYGLPIFDSASTDVIALFNSSALSLKNSSLEYCPGEACITFFNTQNYLSNPIHLTVENTAFNGGAGSAFLTFGDGESVTDIKNSSIKNFTNYGVENYASVAVQAKNNDWGDPSGPYHSTLNPSGLGQKLYGPVDFDPWIGKAGPIPETYYARITDAPDGVGQMCESASKDSVLIKTFPNDWVLKVFYATLTPDGWIKIQDLTDGSEGWMQGGLARLPYDKGKQKEYEDDASDNLSGASNLGNRRSAVLNAVNDYYNNVASTPSLYSSDDTTKISKLKKSNIPVELILAIIAGESGGGSKSGFSNEIVTHDYGHGIMQVTMDAYAHENPNPKYFGVKKNSDDPRGFYSKAKVEICAEKDSDQYKKCYENTQTYNDKSKPYSHYDHNPSNPKYKQYANTAQSVYANIKDGLGILIQKYDSAIKTTFKTKIPCKEGNYTFEGYDFSCEEILKIKTVWYYNGRAYATNKDGVINKKDTNYLKLISGRLKDLTNYFPEYSYENGDHLIEKLAIANRHRIEIQPRSPVFVAIKDSANNIVGEIKNEEKIDIPTGAYDNDFERSVIFFPDDTYTYEIVGDEQGGKYGLDIDIFDDSDEPTSFRATDLPIIPNEKHTYKIDQEKLKENAPDAVTVNIDKDGDGVPERTVYTGNELTNLEPLQELSHTRIVPAGVVPLWAIPQNIISQVLGAQTEALNIPTSKKVIPSSKKKPKSVAIKKKVKNSTVPKKEVVTEPKIQQENKILPTKTQQKKPSLFIRLWRLLF